LDPGHIDTALPAEVVFSGVATAFGAKPVYEQGTCRDSACHGGVFPNGHRSGGSNTAPEWTRVDGSQARCDGCHGMPPPRPHPYPTDCSSCHEDVAKDNLSFSRPELHIDGSVTFTLP
jgi:predicted CxxxxCH...CXXCH cytochrome family protein